MKALVLKEYNNLVYEDFPKPTYKSDEVLIRVKACGISSTFKMAVENLRNGGILTLVGNVSP